MNRLAATLSAGLRGALKALLLFAVELALILWAPMALSSLANRGLVDQDAIVPRSAVSPSQATGLCVEGTPSERADVQHAADDLVWPVGTLAVKIVVAAPTNMPPDCDGIYVYPDDVIYISKRAVEDPRRGGLGHVLAHELGHKFDHTYLDAQGRRQFLQLRGYPIGTPWRNERAAWADRPEEDFAEVYAAFDDPSSGAPIQTSRGRVTAVAQMRALLIRYQPDPARPTSLGSAVVPTLVQDARDLMATDSRFASALAVVAIVSAIASAFSEIQDVPFKARRRPWHLSLSRMRPHKV